MATVQFKQKTSMGRIADRMQFAFTRLKEAKLKLTDLLEMGKSVLETAEYAESKMEVLYWHKRVSELRKLYGSGYPKKDIGKMVGLGSTVKVKYGKLFKEYTIVTSLEADPTNGYISDESPLGRALLNKKESENVSVRAPSGEFMYTVESIK